jgi:NAD(P)-dependent dehydrogenase (short-subunit alcohol dehydrogenase family)
LKLVVIDRHKKELDLALSEIDKNVTGVDGDVSNLSDLDKLYNTVKDQKGHIDILFANAGVIQSLFLILVWEKSRRNTSRNYLYQLKFRVFDHVERKNEDGISAILSYGKTCQINAMGG